jgi:4-hydroxy-3-methylbut-2-en-1-yl diphosphate synthase IspG/GcpE
MPEVRKVSIALTAQQIGALKAAPSEILRLAVQT